jgi:hypothetical protein
MGTGRFAKRLEDLEASAHVPVDEQVEEQPTDPHHEYLAPEDYERQQLLASPLGAGTLRPRR